MELLVFANFPKARQGFAPGRAPCSSYVMKREGKKGTMSRFQLSTAFVRDRTFVEKKVN